jgi:hypothetical protein
MEGGEIMSEPTPTTDPVFLDLVRRAREARDAGLPEVSILPDEAGSEPTQPAYPPMTPERKAQLLHEFTSAYGIAAELFGVFDELYEALEQAERDAARLDWLDGLPARSGWKNWELIAGDLVMSNCGQSIRELADAELRKQLGQTGD